jgi:hypothetical protein
LSELPEGFSVSIYINSPTGGVRLLSSIYSICGGSDVFLDDVISSILEKCSKEMLRLEYGIVE